MANEMDGIPNFDDWIKSRPQREGSQASRLPDLINFAQENNLKVGSTTGGRHNRGSKHYSGNAIDIADSGSFTDQQVSDLSRAAAGRGFLVRDERRRPEGQKVWGGPHVHVEAQDPAPNFDQWQDRQQPRSPRQIPKFDEWAKDSEQTLPPAKRNVQPPAPATSAPSIEQALQRLTEQVNRSMEPIMRPTGGVGELRRAERMDEARTKRILQIQQEEAQRNPFETKVLPRKVARRAAARAQAEFDEEARRQQREPQVAPLTDFYRKQIREAGNRGVGPEQWLNEMSAKGIAGLLELTAGGARLSPAIAGLARLTTGDNKLAEFAQVHAEALQRAAEAEGADRNRVSKAVQNVIAGTVSSAPEMALMAAGAPAPAAFGIGGAARSVGRGERPEQVAKAGLHGAATGAVFEAPSALGIKYPLARIGTIGAGTGALEAVSGQPLGQAVETGVTNALLAGLGEIGRGRRGTQTEAQPPIGSASTQPSPPAEIKANIPLPGEMSSNAEISAHNQRELSSTKFREALLNESIGGNAGPNRAAVNMAIDHEGRIVSIGNIQDLPPDMQNALNTGKLRNATAIIKYEAGLTNPVIERFVVEKPSGSGMKGSNLTPEWSTIRTEDGRWELQQQGKIVGIFNTWAEAYKARGGNTGIPTAHVVFDKNQIKEVRNEPPSEGRQPQRFYHKDWGEVVKAEDQTGARKGRTKVYEEGNPDAIHFPKTADLRGRGNERMVPLKLENLPPEEASSPEAAPIVPLKAAKAPLGASAEATAAGFNPDLSLSQFVRKMGGIVPSEMFRGELDRLRLRDTGTTGLINQKARQGNVKQTADIMMQAANDAGYRDPTTGRAFENPGDFLYAVERDVLGDKIRVSSGEEDFSRAEAAYYAEQEARVRAEESRHNFLAEGRGAELFDRIVDRKASDAEREEYTRLAEQAGISRTESEDLISEARREAEGLQEARGQRIQPPDRPAEPTREAEIVKPWDMTREQIEEEFQRRKTEDDNVEVTVFGPELAKKYNRLQRIANSSTKSHEETDAAYDEVARMEAALSERDRNKLYGIGETGPQLDDLRDYRQSLSNLDPHDPQSLAESMRWAVSRVGNETDPAKMTHEQQVAYSTLREAARIAHENGWDTQAISREAVQAAGTRFSDPDDARFMLDRFIKKREPSTPSRTALPAPTSTPRPETYFQGKRAEYTGEVKRVAGGTFYEVELMEGRHKGDKKVVIDPPKSEPVATTRPAEQLGFVQEGLTQQEPPPKTTSQRDALIREEQGRQAELNPERTAALAKLDEIRRRGMSVEDYARQPDLTGKLPSAEEVARLKELESPEQASVPDQPKLVSPQTGAIDADLLTLGVRPFAKDVAQKAGRGLRGIREVSDAVKSILAPATRGPEARTTAAITRANASAMARAFDIAEKSLSGAREHFARQKPESNYDFIDRVERGLPQPDPKTRNFAKTLRGLLDERRDQVRALGTGKLESFIENYFPHIWKDPVKAKSVFAEMLAKRPMEGGKAFLKQRTIPFTSEGLARDLEPVSSNPVDLTILKLREMDKYLMAHRVMGEMKENGLLKFVKATERIPEGYKKIDDRVATVYGGPSARPEGGQLIRGYYVAPEPAAKILNNYLSPGITGTVLRTPYRAWRATANIMNQAQLGFSFFHAGFTTLDAVISRTATGFEDIFRYGKPVRGAKTLISTPVSPVTNLIRGSKMLREWVEPGSQGAEIKQLVDAMVQAGGRAKQDRFYTNNAARRFRDTLKQGNLIGASLRLPAAALEKASAPVMEWLVPRQKAGIFAEMARRELERLGPDASREQTREAMAKAWDSVDNRMGQLVYDNIFWHKTTKDLAMASVRSVGWNLGTAREVGGGLAEFVTLPKRALKRGRAEPLFTHKMAYATALPFVVGMIGAMTQYLFTGKGPSELKDYFFPKTGLKDENGNDERLALPSYMKDIFHAKEEPGKVVTSKLHPLISTLSEMLSNRDYYGTKIRNEDDPYVRQVKDVALHIAKSFVPFSVRGYQKESEREASLRRRLLPFVGVTPAPGYINKSPAEKLMSKLAEERMPAGTRTKEESERAQLRRKLEGAFRRGQDATKQVEEGIQQGILRPGDLQDIQRDSLRSPLQLRFNRLGVEDALDVYDKMSGQEREQVKDIMQRKADLIADLPVDRQEVVMKRMAAHGFSGGRLRPPKPPAPPKPEAPARP